jgi:hypothetical protein
MADTRCVNPEYQLDVDTMILEYLLYQAIRSSCKAPTINVQNGSSVPDDSDTERMLHAFDGELAFEQILGSGAVG